MTTNSKETTIEVLSCALHRLENKESAIYFLTYDTKNNARAAIKHIYDMALVLRENGFNSKILVEDNDYVGVKNWLDERYGIIPIVAIKDGNTQVSLDDIIVIPELYSNILPEISNIKCIKVMLMQQKEYMFETLPIGSRWSDYGVDRCIATTEVGKKYIQEYFPEALVHKISPYIGENFQPLDKPVKPHIAISCRERSKNRKIISEFYLKFPHLRWITFRDMVQMSYDEFSEALKECMVSVWVDNESTFGTFPLESMKCGVPVIGKVPNTEPEWFAENGFWTYDENKITDILGTFVMAWIEGAELSPDLKDKMFSAHIPYTKLHHEQSVLSIFNTIISQRTETIKNNLEKINNEPES